MKKIISLILLLFSAFFFNSNSIAAVTDIIYQYDDLNRLTNIDYGNGVTVQYNYDEVGNFTTVVAQGNNPPVANDASITTQEDTPYNGTLSSSDIDIGDTLTCSLVTDGSLGSATINSDCSFTYDPGLNNFGPDSFTFQVFDGKQYSNVATVSVIITPVESWVTVPDVVGMDRATAETTITGEQLVVGTISIANSPTVPKGDVISQDPAAGETVLDSTPVNLTISKGPASAITSYEDASDGSTYGWSVFDSDPPGATISNVFDEDLQSRVIELNGTIDNVFELKNEDGSLWQNEDQFLLKLRAKFDDDFFIYVDVDTTDGQLYLVYDASDFDQLGATGNVHHGLGTTAKDGKWHLHVRHLQDDLTEAQSGNTILAVNSIQIYGSGRIADVSLTNGKIINVPAEQPTIQAGIDATYDGDVVLVADGTYVGAGNKNLDFNTMAIIVKSEHGPASTIIDCESDGRGFIFQSGEGEDSIIDGFTIQNGSVNNATYNYDGGGIYISNDSSPTITNCIISGNTARYGGGIYSNNGSPIILECTIRNNIAQYIGGGVYSYYSSPRITNCTINGNEATPSSTGYGGGVYVYNHHSSPYLPTIIGTTISNNDAFRGGGVYDDFSFLKISNCTITANTASDSGGGIFSTFSFPNIEKSIISSNIATFGAGILGTSFGSIDIKNSTITGNGNASTSSGGGIYHGNTINLNDSTVNGNTATNGGGIYSAYSGTLSKSIISNNNATYGGGLFTNTASLKVINCNVVDNQASTSGGAFYSYNSSSSSIESSIISNNSAQYCGGICFDSSSPTIINSIIWGDTPNEFDGNSSPTVSFSNIQGGYSGTGNINQNPYLDANYHLTVSSPKDNGTATGAPTTDIDGNSRPQGAGIDMGSDEYLDPANVMPVADFSATPETGLSPLTVAFTDNSSGTISSWSWNFGDGNTSTAQNPTHDYASPGTYQVYLTVTGPAGEDTIGKKDYVAVYANRPPVAKDGSLSVTEDIDATGTLEASNIEGDLLTFTLGSTAATLGTVNIINPSTGAYTYDPGLNVYGQDTFTFIVNDGILNSIEEGIITVNITAANDPPVAENGTLSILEDTTGAGTLSATDIDDGDVLTYLIVDNGIKGKATINQSNGSYSYKPNDNETGDDTFTYKVNDGTDDSNYATVSVNITAVNDRPVAAAGIDQTVDEGSMVTLNGSGSSDVDDGIATYLWTQTSGTLVSLSDTGAISPTFTTPDVGIDGEELIFSLKVTDTLGLNSTDTVKTTVNWVNIPPVASDDDVSTDVNTPVTLDALDNDTDADGSVLTVNSSSITPTTVNGGTVNVNPDNTITYTPPAGFIGTDSFTYNANDGLLDSIAPATVTVTVRDVDTDGDGLLNGLEVITGCTDPNDADSDDDGILDGAEDANHDGIVDPTETNPCVADSDGDGILDGTEKGVTDADIGPDTLISVFKADQDPTNTTDATDTDTDTDIILDGVEDANQNGMVDEGETDPTDSDSDDDGIPDGVEDANQNGMVDEGETDPLNVDTDNDGTQDGTELGYTLDNVGADTDLTVFVPDNDPTTKTNPLVNEPALMTIINILLLGD